MAREGMNPLRFQHAPYEMKDIIFLVVTHLPCEDEPGYHKDRLEVVQTCLTSMRDRANRDHTFMVWDNDSKPELRDWLQHIFNPDILIMSRNIGKNQARANAIRMMPLSSVVCYSDDDFYYYDDWLKPQIKILNHFNAQLVTGYPCRAMFRWACENTIHWANKHGKLEKDLFIPEQWERDYAVSIGRNPDEHLQEHLTEKDIDYRVTYNGSQAYCHGHHAQFIGYVAKLLPGLNADNGLAMPDEKQFDIAQAKLGLRLATIERLCRHMGNIIHDELRQEIEAIAV